ncbi:MAG TPA: cytochrome C [Parvularcula sp.]|nr:cytochrome C [Parvularcula sp.]HBS31667.1 cytochrome C [Parvularcula sp.]HBS35402.1 cytochrome C [Parvularcula sp.]
MILTAAIAALLAEAATAPPLSVRAPGVANEARARMNWMLNCQGCHQADAKGSAAARTPAMAGEVARFLGVEGGREYLTRVPGVANAGLSDDQLAELLNWTLATFDAAHLPESFTPFSAAELAAGRKAPLVSDAARMRGDLVKKFDPPAHGRSGE